MFRKRYLLTVPALVYFIVFAYAMATSPTFTLKGEAAIVVFFLIFVGFPVALATAGLAFPQIYKGDDRSEQETHSTD